MNVKQGMLDLAQYDLLFLAMAQYKLGRHEDASATFKRVRPGSARPDLSINPDLWREAPPTPSFPSIAGAWAR
jgi:hypothetical protein